MIQSATSSTRKEVYLDMDSSCNKFFAPLSTRKRMRTNVSFLMVRAVAHEGPCMLSCMSHVACCMFFQSGEGRAESGDTTLLYPLKLCVTVVAVTCNMQYVTCN